MLNKLLTAAFSLASLVCLLLGWHNYTAEETRRFNYLEQQLAQQHQQHGDFAQAQALAPTERGLHAMQDSTFDSALAVAEMKAIVERAKQRRQGYCITATVMAALALGATLASRPSVRPPTVAFHPARSPD